MQRAHKVRVTVTVSEDVLRKVDKAAAGTRGASRSSIIDDWLRLGAQRRAQADLDLAIAAYYDNLSASEQREDAEWARFSTASFFQRERGVRPGSRPRARAGRRVK
jgi:metal-responsive CopG/Arc/MetJ family transcriptional regulator